jgi:RecA-family ATPase
MNDRVVSLRGRPRPFKARDAGDFEGRELPERNWLVPGFLVRGSVTMLNGAGGVGKSLLCQQLQVAAALGESWLGLNVPEPMASFGFYCEDDEDELHRRFFDICKHYNCRFRELAGKVRFVSRVGEQNELMTFRYRNDDSGKITPLLEQMMQEVELWRSMLIFIDTVADTFGGNENIRPQARAFIGAVRQLAIINLGGVILTAHPSRAGMLDGSGFSGSTGWEGSVRQRVYLTTKKVPDPDVEGEYMPTDERIMKTMKANYGPPGEKVRMQWKNGVFERVEQGESGISMMDQLDHNRKILDAAIYLVDRGSWVAADPNARSSSLVALARKLPPCKDISWNAALAAQERLIKSGELVVVELGPPSKRRKYIRPVRALYPGEEALF